MKNILYIEDDKIDQLAFQRLTRKLENISCTMVSYVQEALTIIRKDPCDLIITDYHLNDGTAMEVLAGAGEIPVVVVTGTLRDEETHVLRDAGVKEYISKPITREILSQILNSVFLNHEIS